MLKNLRFYYRFLTTLIAKKSKIVAVLLLASIVVGFLTNLVYQNSGNNLYKSANDRFGKRTLIAGVVGSVKTLNPVYEETLAEREINSLVFRGLTKIGGGGEVEPDLAESFERVSETKFKFTLKKDLFWSDGKPVTTDDVVHTINLTQKQNPPSKFAPNFKDIELTVVDAYTIEFNLLEPFAPFLINTTLGIVPAHISLEQYRPVGSGNFRVVQADDARITLESDSTKLIFKLFKNKGDALLSLKLGEIDSLGGLSFFDIEEFRFWPNFNIYSGDMNQRQVTLFFNLENEKFSRKELRQGLKSGIPKDLIAQILPGFSLKIGTSSLPLDSWAYSQENPELEFDPEGASKVLSKLGFKLEDNVLKRDGEILEFSIKTADEPELIKVAEIIQQSLESIGVQVQIEKVTSTDLKDKVLPERNFEAILLVQELGIDPDQYSLWHSSQVNDANITSLQSDKIDKVLEDGRRSYDTKVRKENYDIFNRILADESPAIFLYYPKYFWLVNKRIEGVILSNLIDTSDRFDNIESWTF